MTLASRFHPEARAELFADVEWYDDHEFGLGGRFGVAVQASVDAAAQSSASWAVWPGWDGEPRVRSKGVVDFPYRVVYFVRNDSLIVVAVAHTKRRPGYWRERVPAP